MPIRFQITFRKRQGIVVVLVKQRCLPYFAMNVDQVPMGKSMRGVISDHRIPQTADFRFILNPEENYLPSMLSVHMAISVEWSNPQRIFYSFFIHMQDKYVK